MNETYRTSSGQMQGLYPQIGGLPPNGLAGLQSPKQSSQIQEVLTASQKSIEQLKESVYNLCDKLQSISRQDAPAPCDPKNQKDNTYTAPLAETIKRSIVDELLDLNTVVRNALNRIEL